MCAIMAKLFQHTGWRPSYILAGETVRSAARASLHVGSTGGVYPSPTIDTVKNRRWVTRSAVCNGERATGGSSPVASLVGIGSGSSKLGLEKNEPLQGFIRWPSHR